MSVNQKGIYTPGGTPTSKLANPPSNEAGSKDSGESQPLLLPFLRSSMMSRSPPRQTNFLNQQEIENDELGNKLSEIEKKNQQENENADLRNRLSEIEKIATQLSNELAKLKKENEELKNVIQQDIREVPLTRYNENASSANAYTEYHTDEEELERDTGWILKKKKRPAKKRRAEFSPEVGGLTETKVTEATKSVHNLQHHQQLEQRKVEIKVKAPPPINVIGITEFANIQALMKTVTTKDYRIVALNNNVWKINTADSDSYRALATKLNEEGKEWFTYEDKNNRTIKVMARGLHPTCKKEDIIEDLKKNGLQIEDATNILKREKIENNQGTQIQKRGLPLFMLTFNKSEKIENIFNIKAILNMRVKIEPLKKNTRLIPQCKKCQGFNHTQKYCARETRCVKCAGKHNAKECTENRNNPAKCINCKGNHPANYRGCEVAVELQRQRNKTRQGPRYSNTTRKEKPTTTAGLQNPQAIDTVRKSYSQILQQSTSVNKESPLEKILRSIETINARLAKQERGLEAIYKRLERQETTNEITSLLF